MITIVLVHLTRVYDWQVNWSNTSRRHLPGIGMKLRGALYHTCWRPVQTLRAKVTFSTLICEWEMNEKYLLTGNHLADFH